jgi:hypothetical protein
VNRRSGKFIVKNPAKSESSVREDRCQKSEESRDIRRREIGVPEDKEVETLQVPKPRRNRDRSSERTRGRNQRHRGKSRQGVIHRCLGVIGISGIPVTKCLYTLVSRTVKSRRGGRFSVRPAVSTSERREAS